MALYRDPVIPPCKTRIIAAVTDQDPLAQTEVKELLRSFKENIICFRRKYFIPNADQLILQPLCLPKTSCLPSSTYSVSVSAWIPAAWAMVETFHG